jgi:hypothetical protein
MICGVASAPSCAELRATRNKRNTTSKKIRFEPLTIETISMCKEENPAWRLGGDALDCE